MRMIVNNAETMRIDTSGIVNIGTATGTQPSYFNSYLNVQNNASTSNHASITITAGSSGYAGLHFGDSDNGRIGQVAYNNSNNSLLFTANNSTRMTIDSSGNVGIAATPPTNGYTASGGGWKMLQIGQSSQIAAYGTDDEIGIFQNTYLNSSGVFQAITSNVAGSSIILVDGKINFKRAATSGTAQTTSTSMVIDSDGNVTVNEGNLFLGATSSKTGTAYFWSNANDSRMSIANTGSAFEIRATYLSTAGYKPIDFYTSDSLSMRITSDGDVLIGKNTSDIEVVGFRIDGVSKGRTFASIVNTNATYYVRDTTNTLYRFYVTGAGQIHATSTSISSLSDVTLKENIKPLETGLDEVMKLQPRRFDWKNGDEKNIAGFIAQEVEEVLPDLVGDYKYDDEETKKALKMGDMIPTLVNAIQELKAEIDDLKNKCNCK
jgi:hypothetical protein